MKQYTSDIKRSWEKLHHPLFIAACILSTFPIFIPEYPPMVDLPQHAGQTALFDLMLSDDFEFGNLLEIQWLTPYWLGYTILYLLSKPFGIALACKITVAVALAGFPLSADRFLRSQNGNPYWSWLFIPAAYGFAFEWGFLNFLIAIPLGFLFLASIKPLASHHTTKETIAVVLWCHLLFLAHVLALVFFISSAALLLYSKDIKTWLRRLAPLFSIAPLFILWFISKIIGQSETQGTGPWGLGPHRFWEFFPNMLALPHKIHFIIASMLICALAFFAAPTHRPTLNKAAPFALYTVFMLIGPNYLFGTFFVYNRFSYIGLPLLLLMFTSDSQPTPSESKRRLLNSICVAIAMILTSYQAAKIISYAEESRPFQETIAHTEKGKRVLGLVFSRGSAYFSAPVYLHYPVWYQASKQGLVDFNFASFFPQVVRYKQDSLPPADPNFVWMPHTFQWHIHEKYGYTYFLVKYPQDISQNLFPNQEAELIANAGDWWLYKNAKDKDQRSTAETSLISAP